MTETEDKQIDDLQPYTYFHTIFAGLFVFEQTLDEHSSVLSTGCHVQVVGLLVNSSQIEIFFVVQQKLPRDDSLMSRITKVCDATLVYS